MTAQAVTPSLNQPLAELDPDIAEVLTGELTRQRETLEMIASENFVPRAVLECQGSVLTNKYAEGYPGRRYYGTPWPPLVTPSWACPWPTAATSPTA